MSDLLVGRISAALASEKTLEGLVRQLLEMLEMVTSMESTYLTRIESDKNLQHVLFSRNSRQMQIPEGISVPWEDSLCKRALNEECFAVCDVSNQWADSQAAKQLGITSYVTTPVRLDDGTLYGTLCAASGSQQSLDPRGEQILNLFAELIAQYIQKEQLLHELQESNAALTTASNTDELTQLPNRRAVFHRLASLFSRMHSDGNLVLIAYIDLDGFKQINDRFGHDVGDDFLCAVAQRLKKGSRAEDLVGRLGGDEFIIAGTGPGIHRDAQEAAVAFKAHIAPLLPGHYQLGDCHIDYMGASVGTVAVNPQRITPDQALGEADAVMYTEKKRRKQMH